MTKVYGIGINDANYKVHESDSDGLGGTIVYWICEYYSRWRSMLKRCYDTKYQDRQPTYKGCFVCKEWLFFSNFKSWMEKQDWKGKQLDKDIIKPGNKEYSPELCCFVNSKLNTLFANKQKSNSGLPIGLTFNGNLYIVYCLKDGKPNRIGSFNNEKDASDAYIGFKVKIIKEAIKNQTDKRIIKGLNLHINSLQSNLQYI